MMENEKKMLSIALIRETVSAELASRDSAVKTLFSYEQKADGLDTAIAKSEGEKQEFLRNENDLIAQGSSRDEISTKVLDLNTQKERNIESLERLQQLISAAKKKIDLSENRIMTLISNRISSNPESGIPKNTPVRNNLAEPKTPGNIPPLKTFSKPKAEPAKPTVEAIKKPKPKGIYLADLRDWERKYNERPAKKQRQAINRAPVRK